MASNNATNSQIEKIRKILDVVPKVNDTIKRINGVTQKFEKNLPKDAKDTESLIIAREIIKLMSSIASEFISPDNILDQIIFMIATEPVGKGIDYIFSDTSSTKNIMSFIPDIKILKPIEQYPGYYGKEFRTSDYFSASAAKNVIELLLLFTPLSPVTLLGKIFNGTAKSVIDVGLQGIMNWNDNKTNEEAAKNDKDEWTKRRDLSKKLVEKAFNGTYPQIEIAMGRDKAMKDALIYFLQTDKFLYEEFKQFEKWLTEEVPGYKKDPLFSSNPAKLQKKIDNGKDGFVYSVNKTLAGLIEKLWKDTNENLNFLNTFEKQLPKIQYLASGGFTDGISIAGEAGTEAVISFDPAYHSQNIGCWEKAGELLGVYSTEEALMNAYNHENSVAYNNLTNSAGKLLGFDDFTLGEISGNDSVIYKFGEIKFEPNIHVTGNSGNREEIVKVIKESEYEFQGMFDEWFENWKKRNISERYANSYNRIY